MLIHNKDDIEFVTEFPCFLGHPVHEIRLIYISIINTHIEELLFGIVPVLVSLVRADNFLSNLNISGRQFFKKYEYFCMWGKIPKGIESLPQT